MSNIIKNCAACGAQIKVRLADHNRGWGRFCDKACAAAHKCGQRPRDVNKRHSQYSNWAAERFEYFESNGWPEKAPSIKHQIGKTPKVKPVKRNYPHNTTDEIDHDALAATEAGWDGHKVWTQ